MNSFKKNLIYAAYTNGIFFDVDQMTLTHLYQPIIGPNSVSLYLILLGEAQNMRITFIRPDHSRLLKILNISENQYMEAKNKLEAIGLLKTYVQGIDIIYLIYPPITPKSFISTSYLANKLKNILGELDFDRTVYFFSQKLPELSKATDISKKYDQMFLKDEKESNIADTNVTTMLNRDKQAIEYDAVKQLNDLFIKNNLGYEIKTIRQKELILKIIEETNITIKDLYEAIASLVNTQATINYKQIIKALEVNLNLNNFMRKPESIHEIFDESLSDFQNGNVINLNKTKNALDASTDLFVDQIKNNNNEDIDTMFKSNSPYEMFFILMKKEPELHDKKSITNNIKKIDIIILNCLMYYVFQKQPNHMNWNYIDRIIDTIDKYGYSHDYPSAKKYIQNALAIKKEIKKG